MSEQTKKGKEPTRDDAVEVLKKIVDPELMIDIWTLGLIYEVLVKEKDAIFIKMTFTTPLCPYAPELVAQIRAGLTNIGFTDIEMAYSFDPPWEPSEEVKMLLGIA